ncbi:MAG: hypothetical protein IJF01_07460 [Tidjanibacter sp.]|nr:hypothetical protein [Tidjanibacter sp.]
MLILFIIFGTIVWLTITLHKERNRSNRKIKEYIERREQEFVKEKEQYFIEKSGNISERENQLEELIQSATPFKDSATLVADVSQALRDDEVKKVFWGKRLAFEEERYTTIKQNWKEQKLLYKELLYKVEFLTSIFPELKQYISDESELLELGEAKLDLDQARSSYDRVRDYIEDREYKTLSITERNQLALNKWLKNVPKYWIGRIYEMYVGQEIKKHRTFKPTNKIDMYGIRTGMQDLGRDIIYYSEYATYIIQCKCWAMSKEIHEKVMCQTLGTAVEFKVEREMKHDSWGLMPDIETVVPVIVTPTPLSDVAQRFAKHLKIKVITTHKPIEEIKYMVPLIKCNINNGNKIYHLPFDQQYHRTIIDETKGEFYAMTVKEAEEKGFRRAFRHRNTE